MTRPRLRLLPASADFGLRLLILAIALHGCGPSEPTSTTLAALVRDAPHYQGVVVDVSGTLRSYPNPRHYWIEDAHPNRVEVIFKTVEALPLGSTLKVRGQFSYSTEQGRRIAVDQFIILSPATPLDVRLRIKEDAPSAINE